MLRITGVCALAWICLVPAQFAHAVQPADEVTRVVRAQMEKQHIPGLALLVSRNGVPIREEGFGLASLELKVGVTPKTIFQSGSIGKQFTATAVMLLVEEGKIALNDPLSKYFSDAPSWWSGVTIRELLGLAISQFDGGWQLVFHNPRFGEMGCGTLYREGIEGVEQAGDVDSRCLKRRQTQSGSLWIRMVC